MSEILIEAQSNMVKNRAEFEAWSQIFKKMRKTIGLILAAFILLQVNVKADEGMWLLPLIEKLNMDEMRSMGLELSADQIYDINNSSLKDAIVALDRGSCTAELISSNGLILTNHHCGYDEIQSHSSVEHNYLEDGFWASKYKEELPNPGKTATFLIRMEDVTEKVLAGLTDDMSEEERDAKIEEITSGIENEATKDNEYEATVRSFFGGNDFYLVITETFKDVRLVGAPPSSIGKFGADTDNWMWPRHTGDFALFRIYSGPDGKPAEYSEDNIPYTPRHVLPISLEGVKEGDFTMVLGYPGSTDRYITSWEVRELLDVEHPNRIKIRGIKQDLWMEDMRDSEEIKIKYASKYSRSSNYWKYSIGQSKGLKRLNVYGKKKELEDQFIEWVDQDQQRAEKYGEALELIEKAVTGRKEYVSASQYLIESFYFGIEPIGLALSSQKLYMAINADSPNQEMINETIIELKKESEEFFKDYNQPTAKKVTLAMLKLYYMDVPSEFHLEVHNTIMNKYKGNFEKYVDKLFNKSIFVDQEKFNEFLENPKFRSLQKDMFMELTIDFSNKYQEINSMSSKYDKFYEKGTRLFIEGLRKMKEDKTFYPDANSTMRLTYGIVDDYYPMDAVHYDYYTTLQGVMEKEDPGNWEFVVPEKLKELYKNKDFGRYGKEDYMPLCFISNNDITGGNSGSPVLNSKGELIGVAFDGNWEAMSGDVVFEPELQRCINVDIRYVLFIIDKFAGATNLIDEMEIIE